MRQLLTNASASLSRTSARWVPPDGGDLPATRAALEAIKAECSDIDRKADELLARIPR